MLKLDNLGTPLRKLAIRGLRFFYVRYSPHYEPSSRFRETLALEHDLMKPMYLWRLQNEQQYRGIWLLVFPVAFAKQAIVRGRGARRVRAALEETLIEKGYDRQGVSLTEGQPHLRGTVEVAVTMKESVNAPFEEIKTDAHRFVNALQAMCAEYDRSEKDAVHQDQIVVDGKPDEQSQSQIGKQSSEDTSSQISSG